MKKLLVLTLAAMLLLSAAGCGKKLVSDTCAICGKAAAKNYVNNSVAINVEISGYPALQVDQHETVALCDTHFTMIEYAAGPSK